MKPDGRGATGAMPQLVGGEALDDGLDVFADLLQGVRGGLEVRLGAGHRAAEPDFGNSVHARKIWAILGTVTNGQETMRLRYVPVLLAGLPAVLAARQRGLPDPGSQAKLRAVFPAVESVMREFTGREHVPGAA